MQGKAVLWSIHKLVCDVSPQAQCVCMCGPKLVALLREVVEASGCEVELAEDVTRAGPPL